MGRGVGEGPGRGKIFLILDLKMANCGAFLVQFFAVFAPSQFYVVYNLYTG